MVLKELIFKSCYIGRVWWSSKNRFLPFSNLGGCGGLERMILLQFLLWECVVVLKRLIFNSFYVGMMWCP